MKTILTAPACTFVALTTACGAPPDPQGLQNAGLAAAIPSASPLVLRPQRPSPPKLRAVPPPAPDPPLALVGLLPRGVALIDPSGPAVVASSATDLPVVDADYDAIQDRWIVSEFEDSSASRLSVWRLAPIGNPPLLARISSLELDAYTRWLSLGTAGLLMQDDGLDARWSFLSQDLSSTLHTVRSPMPASIFAALDSEGVHATGLIQSDTIDGPVTSLTTWSVRNGSAIAEGVVELRDAWATLQPIRACMGDAGRIVIATATSGRLVVAAINDSAGQPQMLHDEPIPGLEDVGAIACNPQTGECYAMLSGVEELAVIPLRSDAPITRTPLHGHVGTASSRWFTRTLDADPASGMVIVGTSGSVSAFRIEEGRAKHAWTMLGVRWPVRFARGFDGG